MWLWRWNLMKMEVEEQWKREKQVVCETEKHVEDKKERAAERKIYLFLGLEISMKCYK